MQNKYLTVPDNFESDNYDRFNKLNLIIQDIIKEKKREITIVDIGSGNGQFMYYVKSKLNKDAEVRFIGIDKYVKDKFFDFDLRNEDVEGKLSLEDKSADIVICAEIIEHIKDTDNFIQEVKRITRDDGDILITTPNLASYFNRFLLLFGYQPYHSEVSNVESGFGLDVVYKVLGRSNLNNPTAGHLRLFTFRALKDFIDYYGLKIVGFYPVFFSSFRSDNSRVFIIKVFFWFDKMISSIMPKLATGLIFHVKIKNK